MTLLLLGLRWWAMLVYALMRRGMDKTEGQPLQVLGLIIALGVMVATHLWFVNFLGAAIVGGGLVVWFWLRGIHMTQMREREDNLIVFFKIGFGILLLELFITVFTSDDMVLHATATRMFTTFFLSGLLALSFSRLSGMRDTQAGNLAQTSATRNWLFALTCIWGMVVFFSLVLETFSFQRIQTVLQPLWNFLGLLVNAILYTFNFLFGGLFSWLTPRRIPFVPLPPKTNPSPATTPSTIAPQALFAGRLIILLIAFALLFIIIIVFLRRWNVRFHEEDEEEVRESLPVREIARERQEKQRRTHQAAMLEPLSPDSVRAHYRDLLQTMAWQKDELARRPDETPDDYQQRLFTLLKQLSSTTMLDSDMPPDVTILAALTQAYDEERYGSEHDTTIQPGDTHSWAEQLARRLSGSGRKEIS